MAGHSAFAATDRHTGRVLSWADGQWDGDPDSVLSARIVVDLGNQVPLTPRGPWVDPDPQNPVAAVAIIQAALRGNLRWSGQLPDMRDVTRVLEGEIS